MKNTPLTTEQKVAVIATLAFFLIHITATAVIVYASGLITRPDTHARDPFGCIAVAIIVFVCALATGRFNDFLTKARQKSGLA